MSLDIARLNLRDLGGLSTADGRQIRPGRLLRAGALWSITQAERGALAPLLAVYDMRSQRERQFYPEADFPGALCRQIAVTESGRRKLIDSKRTLADKVDDILKGYARQESIASVRMREVYRRMVCSPEMLRCVEEILGLLASHPEGAVLWHCAAGKDRTGVMAAILLRLLDVPEEAIYEDYLRSNPALQEEIAAAEQLALARTGSAAAACYVKGFFLACPCWLDAALSYLDQHYQSAQRYVLDQSCITQGQLSAFRESCLR